MQQKAAILPLAAPAVEPPPHVDGELSEEDPDILALETKLRAMREARRSRDASRGLAVS